MSYVYLPEGGWLIGQIQTRLVCNSCPSQEESTADVCQPIGNLVENDYKQTGHICTPYEYRETADIN